MQLENYINLEKATLCGGLVRSYCIFRVELESSGNRIRF